MIRKIKKKKLKKKWKVVPINSLSFNCGLKVELRSRRDSWVQGLVWPIIRKIWGFWTEVRWQTSSSGPTNRTDRLSARPTFKLSDHSQFSMGTYHISVVWWSTTRLFLFHLLTILPAINDIYHSCHCHCHCHWHK